MHVLNFVLVTLLTSIGIEGKILTEQRKFEVLAPAVAGVVKEIYSKIRSFRTINLLSVETSDNRNLEDFKDEFSQNLVESTKLDRYNAPINPRFVPSFRKDSAVMLIESFEDFMKILKQVIPKHYIYSGQYLIVSIEGRLPEIEKMFKILWEKQIFNVNIMFEENGIVKVETFMPFKPSACGDTTPMPINLVENGKIVKKADKLLVDKMKNLFGCPIRVSAAYNSPPYTYITQQNGVTKIQGTEVSFIEAISKTLNFTVDYAFLVEEAYFTDDGKAQGPLKPVAEGEADLSAVNFWLMPNRLKFLDATNAYSIDRIVFLVPPGATLTAFEKLYYPFTLNVWLFILFVYVSGTMVICVMKTRSTSEQRFVFGSGTSHHHLNLFTGFVGQFLKTLPKRNFARFLLMSFFLYSLVMRSLYQGLYYSLMHSNTRHKAIQSIDDILHNDFKIYGSPSNVDHVKALIEENKR